MDLRGVAGWYPQGRGRRRDGVVVLLVVSLVAVLLLSLSAFARGAGSTRCERFAGASAERAAQVTGRGTEVLVIGDSYAAGLGLDHPVSSWPSRLEGRVHVAGFSGSGFSTGASDCPGVSFADRAPGALRRGSSLVVVEGGLNDYDQSSASVAAGFRRLMTTLAGHRVVVVGPPAAPSRVRAVGRVDRLLERLSRQHGADYVRTSGWSLSYLDDRLHLTPAGHRAFGDAVARELAARS